VRGLCIPHLLVMLNRTLYQNFHRQNKGISLWSGFDLHLAFHCLCTVYLYHLHQTFPDLSFQIGSGSFTFLPVGTSFVERI
jgi:hypothetical protein